MYASSRMLYAMAKDNMAPKVFAKLNKSGVPINAIILTTIIASACFLTGIFAESSVYVWLVAASGLAGFISWLGIAICHYRFRKAYVHQGKDLGKLPYKAKLFPIGPIIALVLCTIVIIGQGFSYIKPDGIEWMGVISSYIGIPLFTILWIYYKVKYKTKVIKLEDVNLDEHTLERNIKKEKAIEEILEEN